jgi:signal transduction histidine kinase
MPLVFCGVPKDAVQKHDLGPNVTGVCLDFDWARTLELAAHLQPAAHRVFLVAGTADIDQSLVRQTKNVFADQSLETTYLIDQSVPQLLAAVRRLAPDSIVLYTSVFRDPTGRTLVPREVLRQLAQASGAPIYGVAETYIGYGVVGGAISSFEIQGRQAAQLALRILAGEKPETIPVQLSPPAELMVDWRELRRRGIREELLPSGTAVLFRQPSLWDSYRWYIIAAAAAIAGQTAMIIAFLLQRTRRNRAEAVAQQQRIELAHAARLTMIGELAASIAHEINQPLGAILSNAEAAEILLESDSPPLEDIRQIFADIRKDDLRANEIIRHMRDLLRKRELELNPIDLNEVTSEALMMVDIEARRQEVAIEKQFSTGLPAVHGDAIYLQQVLLNLVLNGMEAMSELPARNRHLIVRTAINDIGKVEVAVADSGPGIPADRLPQLFDSFFTTKKNGMGLGLSIARSIVEAHGGRLWAEPKSCGACFRFTLPVNVKEALNQSAGTKEPLIETIA